MFSQFATLLLLIVLSQQHKGGVLDFLRPWCNYFCQESDPDHIFVKIWLFWRYILVKNFWPYSYLYTKQNWRCIKSTKHDLTFWVIASSLFIKLPSYKVKKKHLVEAHQIDIKWVENRGVLRPLYAIQEILVSCNFMRLQTFGFEYEGC